MRCVIAAVNAVVWSTPTAMRPGCERAFGDAHASQYRNQAGEEGGAGVHEHDGGRYGLSVGPQRPGERGRVQQLGREVAGHGQCNVAG
jgi:hypothetical protein